MDTFSMKSSFQNIISIFWKENLDQFQTEYNWPKSRYFLNQNLNFLGIVISEIIDKIGILELYTG